jgi:hypothetical protein
MFNYYPEETISDYKVSELSVIYHTNHLVVKLTLMGAYKHGAAIDFLKAESGQWAKFTERFL